MQNRVRNANINRLRSLIDDNKSVETISQLMGITVEALTPFMPVKDEAPPKKTAAKKRVVKKKVVTDGQSD